MRPVDSLWLAIRPGCRLALLACIYCFAAGNATAQGITGYTVVDLGTLGGPESRAKGIDAQGRVVGSSHTATGGTMPHAFVFEDGMMQDLGTFGGSSSYAYAINTFGAAVGYAQRPGDAIGRAFVYENGLLNDIGTLGGSISQGNDINDIGRTAGWADITGNSAYHAFLRVNNAMLDLGTQSFPIEV